MAGGTAHRLLEVPGATSERLPRPVEVGRSQGYRKGSILADWLSSTDHKIIGHRYLITSFGFFLAGSIMAMIMCAQLMGPGQPHRVGLLDAFPRMIV